ncbi:MAG: GNAT family N-acetyltransferase [Planctomycetia bacterium]|nr:GNAT family N-acetyltransferase [Planctomycetia bacterium]
MPLIETTVACPLHDSFRVQQVAGMFDVPLAEKLRETFSVEVPALDEPWQIGLIVGPSGSGKTSIARAAFGEALYRSGAWPADRAVIDCLGDAPIKQLTGLLTSVGFGSPPAWLRPYDVLSGGERFRCDLVRALRQGEQSGLLVFDEFTSVVDRTAARYGAAALAKALRGESLNVRFVAVACHYDIAEWLEPDWVTDMATGTCQRRRLRRPRLRLEVHRAGRAAWRMFSRHHYLTGSLAPGARCFVASCDDQPIAFCATLAQVGHRHTWRITRLVTLPDYQGIGVGSRLMECVADIHLANKERLLLTSSHPAMLAHCERSPRWRLNRVRKHGSRPQPVRKGWYRGSWGRATASFECLGRGEVGRVDSR